jgi:hypothetical protein
MTDRPPYTPDRFLRCVARYIMHRARIDAFPRRTTPPTLFEVVFEERLRQYWEREARKAGRL